MSTLANNAVDGCRLSELLRDIVKVSDRDDCLVSGLSIDSRKTQAGDLFLAYPGVSADGRDFVQQAIQAGAVAVVYEQLAPEGDAHAMRAVTHQGLPIVAIVGLRQRISEIAARFYRHPSRSLWVIGVTGTNGKTSCSQFLAQALHRPAAPWGVIGTLGHGLYGQLNTTDNTTPDAVAIQGIAADMHSHGAQGIVMEVSSHGLEQGRVDAVAFEAAVFTNLSRDHLDYHKDMASYAQAKQRLFHHAGLRYAVINGDDTFGRALIASMAPEVHTVAYTLSDATTSLSTAALPAAGGSRLKPDADPAHLQWVRGTLLRADRHGLEIEVVTPWGEGRFCSGLLGSFNANNLLAVLATLVLTGMPFSQAIARLEALHSIPGRMECFGGRGRQPLVVVDYAHSPAALEAVLVALQGVCDGVLWCVFGCGGERDRGKRPMMGQVAQAHAQRVVLTSDNPRREDAEQIIGEIQAGMSAGDGLVVIADRGQAIAHALRHADQDDVVLVAGKGHESYQWIGDEKFPYSDRDQVRHCLREVA